GKVVNPFLKKHYNIDLIASISTFGGTSRGLPSLVPNYGGEPLAFPELPGGLYKGTLKGLWQTEDRPLAIISLPESRQLVVMVGLAGWTPKVISFDDATEYEDGAKIRVASNGVVLDMQGQVTEGGLTGTYENVATREKGEWSLRPVAQK